MVVKHQFECRQEDHVQRCPLGLGERPEPPGQFIVQCEIVLRTAKHLNRRSRPVGRQIEHGQRAGQLFLPVVPEPFAGRTRQHCRLPTNEIRVLRVKGRERRGTTVLFRRIQHTEFIQYHRERPEIDHDMMNYQHQDMFLRRSSEHIHPHDRPAFQIKPALSFLDQPGLQLIRAPGGGINLIEVDRLLFVDLLNGFAGLYRNRGPQGRMTIHQRLKRAPESRDVHLGSNARRKTDIVNRTFRRELAQKPYPLLIIGERMKRLGLACLFPQELRKKGTLFSW